MICLCSRTSPAFFTTPLRLSALQPQRLGSYNMPQTWGSPDAATIHAPHTAPASSEMSLWLWQSPHRYDPTREISRDSAHCERGQDASLYMPYSRAELSIRLLRDGLCKKEIPPGCILSDTLAAKYRNKCQNVIDYLVFGRAQPSHHAR